MSPAEPHWAVLLIGGSSGVGKRQHPQPDPLQYPTLQARQICGKRTHATIQ